MASKKTDRTIAAPADLQCGHGIGLTPPDYFTSCTKRSPRAVRRLRATQEEMWTVYLRICRKIKPDTAIWMGDLIEGKGTHSEGTELIESDRGTQCDMAVLAIQTLKAPVNIIIRGTPSHTGKGEQWEDQIAKEVNAQAHDHEWLKVHSTVFDCKHKVARSAVPYGGWTPLAREEIWNALWHDAGLAPRADWILRGHTHTCLWGGRMVDNTPRQFMSLPALQAMGSRFGKQQCIGLVDWGLVYFTVPPEGTCHPHLEFVQNLTAEVQKAKII